MRTIWCVRAAAAQAAALAMSLAGLLAQASAALAEPPTVSVITLARELIDLDRLAGLGPVSPARRVLSAQHAENQPLGADGWSAPCELRGPGAIRRIGCSAPAGRMRLALDGGAPREFSLKDLFAGAAPSLVAGFGSCGPARCESWFPMPFARACIVQFDAPALRWRIDYEQYDGSAAVEPLPTALDAAATEALGVIGRALQDGLNEKQLFGGRKCPAEGGEFSLAAGEKYEWPIESGGTIRALYIGLSDRRAPRQLYALHNCVLRIWFDGEREPRVEAPLVDFFGCGFDWRPYNSMPMGTDLPAPIPMPGKRFGEDRVMYCYWPMPFSQGARIELENRNSSGRPIGFLLFLRVEAGKIDERAPRFHARFRRIDTAKSQQVTLATLGGPARVVGLTALVDTPVAVPWWQARIDFRPLKRPGGTLAELIAPEGAWADDLAAFVQPGPFGGLTRAAPSGKSALYHWFGVAADGGDSVEWRISNPPADSYFAGILYWYAPPQTATRWPRLRPDDLAVPGLRIPGAIEIESALSGQGWGDILTEKEAGGVELSAGRAAVIRDTNPVTLLMNAPRAGRALLRLRVHPRRAFETIELQRENGEKLGEATYRAGADGWYVFEGVDLRAGENRLRLRCLKPATLDCMTIEFGK